MLIIELNEFNPGLLARAAADFSLKNFARVLAMPHTETMADCEEERHGLDPWVQWVSVHTGLPTSKHGVAHLGDVQHLRAPQFWESLAEKTPLRFGLWGVMNAAAGKHPDRVDFFFPDPWTFSEPAFPEELNQFLALPRYYAKNYLDLKWLPVTAAATRLVAFCLHPRRFGPLASLLPAALTGLRQGGPSTCVLFSLFDLVAAKLFAQYQHRHNPDVSVVFLNAIAHMQHRAWAAEPAWRPEMVAGLRLVDQALGILLEAGGERPVIVLNGFRQECAEERADFLYRQENPVGFLARIGLHPERVEPMMTNDAQLFFRSAAECAAAADRLRGARLAGRQVFDVQINAANDCQLFYQLDFWQQVPADATLDIGDERLLFRDWFERVTQRTGVHVPVGDIYSTQAAFPQQMPLHAFAEHLSEHLCRNNPSTS